MFVEREIDLVHRRDAEHGEKTSPTRRSLRLCGLTLLAAAALPAASLDFQFYRARVEPLFLKKRPGLIACYKCHSANNVRFLQRLPAGRTTFTEEESRRNFETVSLLVTAGEPLKSRILVHPLAAEAGGDPFHSGGKHWQSQDDPDWKTLSEWVRGRTTSASK